jgi:hypothetical protein
MRDASDQAEHQKAWELLPWYVNGTLASGEHEYVAHHIARCQSCTDEIGRCQSMASAVRSAEATAPTPTAESFARLMERIDAAGKPAAAQRGRTGVGGWSEKIRLVFQQTPAWSRWALVAQSAAMVLLAAVLVWQPAGAPSSLYRTLSDAGSSPEPGRGQLQVVFADDITEREIRSLLGSIGGMIVSGPTPMAVYTVALAAGEGEASAHTGKALALLRANPKVRLAEAKGP